ncbi:hypothetical protein BKA69DRAFT_1034950 [Paraphysoderma sedebokerense]|nr:hypothetical protein BKA69DRAFT_1034950 [Paraphysoderma sedebokerense]
MTDADLKELDDILANMEKQLDFSDFGTDNATPAPPPPLSTNAAPINEPIVTNVASKNDAAQSIPSPNIVKANVPATISIPQTASSSKGESMFLKKMAQNEEITTNNVPMHSVDKVAAPIVQVPPKSPMPNAPKPSSSNADTPHSVETNQSGSFGNIKARFEKAHPGITVSTKPTASTPTLSSPKVAISAVASPVVPSFVPQLTHVTSAPEVIQIQRFAVSTTVSPAQRTEGSTSTSRPSLTSLSTLIENPSSLILDSSSRSIKSDGDSLNSSQSSVTEYCDADIKTVKSAVPQITSISQTAASHILPMQPSRVSAIYSIGEIAPLAIPGVGDIKEEKVERPKLQRAVSVNVSPKTAPAPLSKQSATAKSDVSVVENVRLARPQRATAISVSSSSSSIASQGKPSVPISNTSSSLSQHPVQRAVSVTIPSLSSQNSTTSITSSSSNEAIKTQSQGSLEVPSRPLSVEIQKATQINAIQVSMPVVIPPTPTQSQSPVTLPREPSNKSINIISGEAKPEVQASEPTWQQSAVHTQPAQTSPQIQTAPPTKPSIALIQSIQSQSAAGTSNLTPMVRSNSIKPKSPVPVSPTSVTTPRKELATTGGMRERSVSAVSTSSNHSVFDVFKAEDIFDNDWQNKAPSLNETDFGSQIYNSFRKSLLFALNEMDDYCMDVPELFTQLTKGNFLESNMQLTLTEPVITSESNQNERLQPRKSRAAAI